MTSSATSRLYFHHIKVDFKKSEVVQPLMGAYKSTKNNNNLTQTRKITFPLRVDSFVENAQISHKKDRFDILGVSNTFGTVLLLLKACHFFSGVTTNKKTNAGVCAYFHCL